MMRDVKIDSVTLYSLHSDVEPRRTHPIQIISKQLKDKESQNVFNESSVEQLKADFYKR